MINLIRRTFQLTIFHFLICIIDRISRLPRNNHPPDVMRILRENMALKAQIRVLIVELKIKRGKHPKVSIITRAAQVFAFLLTRGNKTFQKYYISASPLTISRWMAIFRRGPWPWRKKNAGGRPPLSQKIQDIIIEIKTNNPTFGMKRIKNQLRKMGIKVSETTIQKVLKEHNLFPTKRTGHKIDMERFKSAAKDAAWALDYFLVRTAKGAWLSTLLVIDIYTRELMTLAVHDGWEATSEWAIARLSEAISREKRKPALVVHDRGTVFQGQFERQLRVLEIERRRIPPSLPVANIYAERTVWSARNEILNHIVAKDVDELQWYLDEYRTYYNRFRTHQGIEGNTPEQRSQSSPVPEVISPAEIKKRKLVHHSFAHGLLNAYELVEIDSEPESAAA